MPSEDALEIAHAIREVGNALQAEVARLGDELQRFTNGFQADVPRAVHAVVENAQAARESLEAIAESTSGLLLIPFDPDGDDIDDDTEDEGPADAK